MSELATMSTRVGLPRQDRGDGAAERFEFPVIYRAQHDGNELKFARQALAENGTWTSRACSSRWATSSSASEAAGELEFRGKFPIDFGRGPGESATCLATGSPVAYPSENGVAPAAEIAAWHIAGAHKPRPRPGPRNNIPRAAPCRRLRVGAASAELEPYRTPPGLNQLLRITGIKAA